MNIGIVGLGLIGGSLAKAICHFRQEDTVLGMDKEQSVTLWAQAAKAIHQPMCVENLPDCKMVILALYPGDTIAFLEEHGKNISQGAVVIDCCGVKEDVCAAGWDIAEKYGFHFVGGHPMAGVERSGFAHANGTLFAQASMILVPPTGIDIALMDKLKTFFLSIGFGHIELSSPHKHDEIIAYTSQLAHIVSGAYVKSPTAKLHHGYSAGSYRDMTRVATLNDKMWAELFLRNRTHLLRELDMLIDHLGIYKQVLTAGDETALRKLLREGTARKGEIDGGEEHD